MRTDDEKLTDAHIAKQLQQNELLFRLLEALDKLCYNNIKGTDAVENVMHLKAKAEAIDDLRRIIQKTVEQGKVIEEKILQEQIFNKHVM